MMPMLQPFLFFLFFMSSFIVSNVQAQALASLYDASLIKVIDGDTVKLKLELYPGLYKVVNLRIQGIDAPESRNGIKGKQRISECEIEQGKLAKARASEVLRKSPLLKVSDLDPSKSKYAGRINGKLWFVPQGAQYAAPMDFSLYMIDQHLAIPYLGGARQPWPCSPLNIA